MQSEVKSEIESDLKLNKIMDQLKIDNIIHYTYKLVLIGKVKNNDGFVAFKIVTPAEIRDYSLILYIKRLIPTINDFLKRRNISSEINENNIHLFILNIIDLFNEFIKKLKLKKFQKIKGRVQTRYYKKILLIRIVDMMNGVLNINDITLKTYTNIIRYSRANYGGFKEYAETKWEIRYKQLSKMLLDYIMNECFSRYIDYFNNPINRYFPYITGNNCSECNYDYVRLVWNNELVKFRNNNPEMIEYLKQYHSDDRIRFYWCSNCNRDASYKIIKNAYGENEISEIRDKIVDIVFDEVNVINLFENYVFDIYQIDIIKGYF